MTLDLPTTWDELLALREAVDVEFKRASGADGNGRLPNEFFPTYSAMANTDGGLIVLGAAEDDDDGAPVSVGIKDIPKLRKELWDALHNTQRVSGCVLVEGDVIPRTFNDKHLLFVRVPRADRRHRPVFVGQNPMTGTYERRDSGDYKVPDADVRRMLADQQDEPLDGIPLDGFDLKDLDPDTVKIYRQLFANEKPDHPWNGLPDAAFLAQIGAVRTNRTTGKSGLTRAGLLMLGRWPIIREVFPYYFVDYQERPEAKAEPRWKDRVHPDGTWSGNLLDFYRIVSQKLTANLRMPFLLKGDERVQNTPVHQAIREALVNTLIHADYSGRAAVLIAKRPDLMGFQNPGRMRVAPNQARSGGVSDCRNPTLQTMFTLINRGERAGSGVPTIFAGAKSQLWRPPHFEERLTPTDRTILLLHMVSLTPDWVVEALNTEFGDRFRRLDDDGRVAMVTALLEGQVTHGRLCEMSGTHPRDLTLLLAKLVRDGLLDADGNRKGRFYFLPGRKPLGDVVGFDGTAVGLSVPANPEQSDGPNPEQSGPNSEQSGAANSEQSASYSEQSKALAVEVRAKAKAPKDLVEAAVLALCADGFVERKALADTLNRAAPTLRTHHLDRLVATGLLEQRNPDTKHDPRPAYRTTMSGRTRLQALLPTLARSGT